jgi:hypothetical protein
MLMKDNQFVNGKLDAVKVPSLIPRIFREVQESIRRSVIKERFLGMY